MPPVTTKRALTLEGAKQIAAAAHAEAKKNNWTMTICVVDDGGHPLYLERMDGTQVASVVVAQEKAASAILFKRSTKVFEESVLGGRVVAMKLNRAMPLEGGLPILVGGEYLGAIGISGGTSQQDGIVAAAGVAALQTSGQ